MKKCKYIWLNGKFVEWNNAKTHVLTHALHYGTGVFEGIRAYNTAQGTAIFRAKEHFDRLLDSARIYKMPIKYTSSELINTTKELIKKNNLKSCYIRPLLYRGYGVMGLNPTQAPVEAMIAVWEWGTYLGEEGLEKGIRCKISSWKRIDSQSLPVIAKCSANYANSVLAKTEALECGYDEAIMLNYKGTVAEGPGENIFMIKNNQIFTTPIADGVLKGITAQSIIQIAGEMGFEVIEKSIPREELFTADELFFTGTAAEVTPIREIDGRMIKSQGRGQITKKLQDAFFNVVKGKDAKYSHWLEVI